MKIMKLCFKDLAIFYILKILNLFILERSKIFYDILISKIKYN